MDPIPYPVSNFYVGGSLMLLVILVSCIYVVSYRRARANRRRAAREPEDGPGYPPHSSTGVVWDTHGAPVYAIEPALAEGGGQFGGAGASDSYDSGGGFDSGDAGGDGGGGDGD